MSRDRCPAKDCKHKNNGGKGYKDLQEHLERSRKDILHCAKGIVLEAAMLSLSGLTRCICQECRRIRAKISEEGLCGNCWKKSLHNVRGQVVLDMKVDEQEALVARIIGANNLRMVVVRSIPKS